MDIWFAERRKKDDLVLPTQQDSSRTGPRLESVSNGCDGTRPAGGEHSVRRLSRKAPGAKDCYTRTDKSGDNTSRTFRSRCRAGNVDRRRQKETRQARGAGRYGLTLHAIRRQFGADRT